MAKSNDNESFENLLNQIAHQKKRQFLENYPTFCVTTKTAEATGIGEWVVYNWIRNDEIFSKAFTELKKTIDNTRLQKYEAELDKRVLESPSKHSDILLMFGLKAMNPDKYREKTEHKITGDIKVISYIPRPGAPQIALEKPKELPEAEAE